jgi:hypothetical protein
MAFAEPSAPSSLGARRPFAEPRLCQRLAQTAQLAQRSKVLELGATNGAGGLALSSLLDCEAVVVADSEASVEPLKQEAASLGVTAVVHAPTVELGQLPKGEFNLILSLGGAKGPVRGFAESLRPLLALNGRLCLGHPVKVGLESPAEQVSFWEKRLGEKVLHPRDLLGTLVGVGYEPEWVETLSGEELDALYQACAEADPGFKDSDELRLHRQHGGRVGVTFGLVLARRKEPGEKPPKSRDRG